jgi:hypothetical protein
MLRKVIVAALAAGAGGLLLPATGAFAAASHTSAAGMAIDLGPAPSLPANCPFPNADANFIFSNGNTVSHDTSNKNGDWGGFTAEGTATFYEDTTPWYTGHLSMWGGGGNNAKSQNENGSTMDFHGTGAAGSLDIHANFHATFNAAGTMTANVQNIKITCS